MAIWTNCRIDLLSYCRVRDLGRAPTLLSPMQQCFTVVTFYCLKEAHPWRNEA
jgi:hypothetical protein